MEQKRENRKRLKKVIALSMAIMCIMSSFGMVQAGAASNIKDTYVTWKKQQTYNGTPLYTPMRAKNDYSSVYIKNQKSSAGSLSAWVTRSNKTSINSCQVDRYYGYRTYNGASKNKAGVPKGRAKYLINYVKEDGYRYAGIGVTNSKVGTHTIAWSPDSV